MSLKVSTLEDLCTLITDGAHWSPKDNEKGYFMPSVKDMTEYGFDYTNSKKISKEDYLKLKNSSCCPEEGDVLIAKDGSYLKHCFTYNGEDEIAILSSIAIFRPNTTKIHSKYLEYLFRTPYIKSLASGYVSGVAVPRIVLKDFKTIKLPIPSLHTQEEIIRTINNYDGLIVNNLKRINLLEQAAQNIYKEWFVNMRFPGFESASINNRGIYEGWEEVKIGELLNHEIGGGWGKEINEGDFHNPAFVIRGTDFPDIETGNLENIPFRFHKKSNLSTRKLVAGDIIFEVSGGSTNVGVARSLLVTEKLIANLGNDAMCASFCKLMRPKSICHSYFLFLTLKHLKTTKVTEVYEKRSASNIVNYNWKAFLSDVIILIPNQVLLTRFFTIIKKNIEMQDVLRSQISHLKSARDILLPRLMNQTIEV